MTTSIRYFEVEFERYGESFPICIRSTYEPTLQDIDWWTKSDQIKLGLGKPVKFIEVSEEETKTFFDDRPDIPVLGKDPRVEPIGQQV